MSQANTSIAPHNDKSSLGFWIYLMTDCVLFASLFATFAVLRNATAGGPTGAELFDLNYILIETLILLASSFTVGMALLGFRVGSKRIALSMLVLTGLLGGTFLALEINEFQHLIHEGFTWQTSAFLSSFFTLVGTHGLHIAIGVLWLVYLAAAIYRHGLDSINKKRIVLFALFWHFLDLIWIFIFSIVYLGAKF